MDLLVCQWRSSTCSSCVTEAPRELKWELGTSEGCPEKKLAALFSSLVEFGRAAGQAVLASEFQLH